MPLEVGCTEKGDGSCSSPRAHRRFERCFGHRGQRTLSGVPPPVRASSDLSRLVREGAPLTRENQHTRGSSPVDSSPKPLTDEEPLPVTSQHSTDAEETPTGRTLRDVLDGPIDTKLQLIQHHAKMARLLAEEVLEEEVTDLVGKRYSRKEDGNPFRRWGSNSGSIRIDGEKVPTGGASRTRHRRRGGALSGELSGDEKRRARSRANE